MRHLLRPIAVSLIALSLTGCPPAPKHANFYLGPSEPFSVVVEKINANNAGIKTLWSQLHYSLWVHDDKGKEHYVSDNGVLLYAKPNEFLMRGNSIAGLLFEVGSSTGNDAQFWLTVTSMKTQWWGHYRNIGNPCMDMRQVPIHPNLLIEVLGVSNFDTNFLQQPVPVMKFVNEQGGYYSFTWTARNVDHWIALKEVWYDRTTFLPRRVLLYDEKGRVLVMADLSDHQELGEADGRKVATRYELFFPDKKDQLNFEMLNPMRQRNGVPRPGTIHRRDLGDDISPVQLDKDCQD